MPQPSIRQPIYYSLYSYMSISRLASVARIPLLVDEMLPLKIDFQGSVGGLPELHSILMRRSGKSRSQQQAGSAEQKEAC